MSRTTMEAEEGVERAAFAHREERIAEAPAREKEQRLPGRTARPVAAHKPEEFVIQLPKSVRRVRTPRLQDATNRLWIG